MRSPRSGSSADLFLDGVRVGTVRIRGHQTSWGFGYFEPSKSFSRFAPIFGAWSLLMHADEEGDRITRDMADELAAVESAMDHVHAQMRVADEQWLELTQINIDGPLIEWKQG